MVHLLVYSGKRFENPIYSTELCYILMISLALTQYSPGELLSVVTLSVQTFDGLGVEGEPVVSS